MFYVHVSLTKRAVWCFHVLVIMKKTLLSFTCTCNSDKERFDVFMYM